MEHKVLEMEFYDQQQCYRQTLTTDGFDRKYSAKQWHAIFARRSGYLQRWIATYAPANPDYCCSLGSVSLTLAETGAGAMYGIDISPASVATTELILAQTASPGSHASRHGRGEDDLPQPDIRRRHLLRRATSSRRERRVSRRVARVLKPGDKVLGMEALVYNPLVRPYRHLTPKVRNESEEGRMLTICQLKVPKRHFGRVRARYCHVAAIGTAMLRKLPLLTPPLARLNLPTTSWCACRADSLPPVGACPPTWEHSAADPHLIGGRR